MNRKELLIIRGVTIRTMDHRESSSIFSAGKRHVLAEAGYMIGCRQRHVLSRYLSAYSALLFRSQGRNCYNGGSEGELEEEIINPSVQVSHTQLLIDGNFVDSASSDLGSHFYFFPRDKRRLKARRRKPKAQKRPRSYHMFTLELVVVKQQIAIALQNEQEERR